MSCEYLFRVLKQQLYARGINPFALYQDHSAALLIVNGDYYAFGSTAADEFSAHSNEKYGIAPINHVMKDGLQKRIFMCDFVCSH